jgi:hypothetical protein
MSASGRGMGQKTGSPVFARLVAISPPLAKFRGNVKVSFGPSPVTSLERLPDAYDPEPAL